MNLEKRIILTGGIGCGKSTVSKILRSKGMEIIDADEISKEIFQEKIVEIQALFVTTKTGKDLRNHISNIIFNNPHAKNQYESFIHPLIKTRIDEYELKYYNAGKIFVFDMPLYFEIGNIEKHDYVVVISTSLDNQLNRIIKRDGISIDKANKIIQSQIPIKIKESRADFIIYNNSDIPNLKKQIDELYKIIMRHE